MRNFRGRGRRSKFRKSFKSRPRGRSKQFKNYSVSRGGIRL